MSACAGCQAAKRLLGEALYMVQALEEAEEQDGVARTVFAEAWKRGEVRVYNVVCNVVCVALPLPWRAVPGDMPSPLRVKESVKEKVHSSDVQAR